MPEPKEMVLEVKFAGDSSVYMASQFTNSHRVRVDPANGAQGLSSPRERWERGRSPTRSEKEMLALQIGERRLSSDWFGLLSRIS